MAKHRFKTGQSVSVLRGNWVVPPGRYEIVRPLPAEGQGNQYRVRSASDGHERVVHESELILTAQG